MVPSHFYFLCPKSIRISLQQPQTIWSPLDHCSHLKSFSENHTHSLINSLIHRRGEISERKSSFFGNPLFCCNSREGVFRLGSTMSNPTSLATAWGLVYWLYRSIENEIYRTLGRILPGNESKDVLGHLCQFSMLRSLNHDVGDVSKILRHFSVGQTTDKEVS